MPYLGSGVGVGVGVGLGVGESVDEGVGAAVCTGALGVAGPFGSLGYMRGSRKLSASTASVTAAQMPMTNQNAARLL